MDYQKEQFWNSDKKLIQFLTHITVTLETLILRDFEKKLSIKCMVNMRAFGIEEPFLVLGITYLIYSIHYK